MKGSYAGESEAGRCVPLSTDIQYVSIKTSHKRSVQQNLVPRKRDMNGMQTALERESPFRSIACSRFPIPFKRSLQIPHLNGPWEVFLRRTVPDAVGRSTEENRRKEEEMVLPIYHEWAGPF